MVDKWGQMKYQKYKINITRLHSMKTDHYVTPKKDCWRKDAAQLRPWEHFVNRKLKLHCPWKSNPWQSQKDAGEALG